MTDDNVPDQPRTSEQHSGSTQQPRPPYPPPQTDGVTPSPFVSSPMAYGRAELGMPPTGPESAIPPPPPPVSPYGSWVGSHGQPTHQVGRGSSVSPNPVRRARLKGWVILAGAVAVAAIVAVMVVLTTSDGSSDPNQPVVSTATQASAKTAQAVDAAWQTCKESGSDGSGNCTPTPSSAISLCNTLLYGRSASSVYVVLGPIPRMEAAFNLGCNGDISVEVMLPSRQNPSLQEIARYKCGGQFAYSSSCTSTKFGDLSTQPPDNVDGGTDGYALAGPQGVFWIAGTTDMVTLGNIFNNLLNDFGLSVPQNLSAPTPSTQIPSTALSEPANTAPSAASETPMPSSPSDSNPANFPLQSPLTVTGNDGNSYTLTIAAQDHITDCGSHAYGSAVVDYLKAHTCRGANRILATVDVQGQTVALSIITITMNPAPGENPYGGGYAEAHNLAELENASGTGGMNDLLREGKTLPGVTGGIPQHEAFLVSDQDAGVVIMDAWWVGGTTADQDPALLSLENALALSDATPFP